MEVTAESICSCINAELGGAGRIELCSNLAEGGTTPSIGLLKEVKRSVKIPVFVMIRPRPGDFLYSTEEIDVMKADIVSAKEHGADGIVFGVLNQDGSIDEPMAQQLRALSDPLPVTFHRAFDVTNDPIQALRTLIDLKFNRVLTSGQQPTAIQGAELLAKLIELAKNEIIIVPGCGLREDNISHVLKKTGAKEFHASARKTVCSKMQFHRPKVVMGRIDTDCNWLVTDVEIVSKMVAAAKQVWGKYGDD